MTYTDILKGGFVAKKPLPGQSPNDAGGHYYEIDPLRQLDRFLILGTSAGTYYAQPMALTKESAGVLLTLCEQDAVRAVGRIVEISLTGRAAKKDTLLFALALVASCSTEQAKALALAALPSVARTGTDILMFVGFANELRGWGRGLRRAVARWFTEKAGDALPWQIIKYYQRKGWTLRDLLRLSHPKPSDDRQALLFDWLAHRHKGRVAEDGSDRFSAVFAAFPLLEGADLIRSAKTSAEAAALVKKYGLPWEAVPDAYAKDAEVWGALLEGSLPMTAMVRKLGIMTAVGLLTPGSPATRKVCGLLRDADVVTKARLHPFMLYLAARTYGGGAGVKGKLLWSPVPEVVAALDEAFNASFKHVVPTNQRLLIGLDVSASMRGTACVGSDIVDCVDAGAAVALYFVRSEPNCHTMGFSESIRPFSVKADCSLSGLRECVPQQAGGTDLSLPIAYAFKNNLTVDAFIIITDNQEFLGEKHNKELWEEYRARVNPRAKLIILAAAVNRGSVADPNDPLSFGVVGFDSAAPGLIADFIRETL
jgi:60 kDa SS-A/Ro ribonucleoprotein